MTQNPWFELWQWSVCIALLAVGYEFIVMSGRIKELEATIASMECCDAE